MNHHFFFYNNLNNKDIINKIHNNYSIYESYIIINKNKYPLLVYNNRIIKEELNNKDIKIYGKLVKFNNITLDNIIKNIIKLKVSYNRKHKMFKINNYLTLNNEVTESWIIL